MGPKKEMGPKVDIWDSKSILKKFVRVELVFLIFLVLRGEDVFARSLDMTEPSSIGTLLPQSTALGTPAGVGANNFWDFKDLILKNGITRLEESLPFLPQELRENFVLMYASKSLHEASYQEPRAILFGKDASFVVSFNGSASQRAGSALEMMQWNSKTKALEFYEISFAKSQKTGLLSDVFISPPNPARCVQCHGTTPKPFGHLKPLWSRYSFWFGAYGSKGDRLEEGSWEKTQFLKFKESAPEHARYSQLLFDKQKPEAPFLGEATAEKSKYAPNLRFAVLLEAINAKIIAHRLLKSPKYKALRPTLTYALLCETPDYPQSYLETKSAEDYLSPDATRPHIQIVRDPKIPNWLALSSELGVSPDAWSLLFTESSYFYSSGLKATTSNQVVSELLESDSELSELKGQLSRGTWHNEEKLDADTATTLDVYAKSYSATIEMCAQLKMKASIREYMDLVFQHNGIRYGGLKINDILKSCASCHHTKDPGDRVGPYIPFLSRRGLRAELLKPDGEYWWSNLRMSIEDHIRSKRSPALIGGVQMPLGRYPLTDNEQSVLLDYLDRLMRGEIAPD